MKRVTIAVYKPKPHRDTAVLALVRGHSALLEAEGLITQREPIVMRAGAEAHAHPAVLPLWGEFEAVCDFQSLAALPEAQQPFAEFDGI